MQCHIIKVMWWYGAICYAMVYAMCLHIYIYTMCIYVYIYTHIRPVPSIGLSIHPSIYLSFHPSILLSFPASLLPSFHLPISSNALTKICIVYASQMYAYSIMYVMISMIIYINNTYTECTLIYIHLALSHWTLFHIKQLAQGSGRQARPTYFWDS